MRRDKWNSLINSGSRIPGREFKVSFSINFLHFLEIRNYYDLHQALFSSSLYIYLMLLSQSQNPLNLSLNFSPVVSGPLVIGHRIFFFHNIALRDTIFHERNKPQRQNQLDLRTSYLPNEIPDD
jgi:hypothetical protein